MKSNISKHFAAKAKQGLRNCFADGMVQLPNSEFIRTGMQTFAAQENAKAAEAQKAGVQYVGPTTTDMKDKMIEINNQSANPSYQFGIESPNGRGAQHQFANQSMSDLQGGNNQPYTPGSAGDPRASASIGPKGPTHIAPAAPGRTPLRQWQEPAFADGVVPETADQLMARMTAKYGAPSAGTRAPEPAPTPAPQPVQQAPQPKPQTGGLFDQALRGLRGANDELRKAANYKDGMVHEGPGIVHGPGTTTSDSVNAKLSDGEAVLPAATVAALGGADQVADLIERTNGKAPDRGLRQGQGTIHAEDGWLNTVKNTMADMVKSPDQRAIEAGTATPEQVTREQAGMDRAKGTDSPYDAVTPMAPLGMGAKMAVDAGKGLLSKGFDMAKNAASNLPYVGEKIAKPTLAAGQPAAVASHAAQTATPIVDDFGNAINHVPAQNQNASLAANGGEGASAVAQKAAPVAAAEVKAATPAATQAAGTLARPMATQVLKGMVTQPDDPSKKPTLAAAATGVSDTNSMEYLKANGVDITKRLAPQADANTVNGNGPEKVSQNGLRTIQTANGDVYAGRSKNGQLVVTSGLDDTPEQKAAKDASGFIQATQLAAKDKARLKELQYEKNLYNATNPDIKDTNAKAAGIRGLAQYVAEGANSAKNGANQLALARLMKDIQGQQQAQDNHNEEASIKAAEAAGDRYAMEEKDGKPFINPAKKKAFMDALAANMPMKGKDGRPVRAGEVLKNTPSLNGVVDVVEQQKKDAENQNIPQRVYNFLTGNKPMAGAELQGPSIRKAGLSVQDIISAPGAVVFGGNVNDAGGNVQSINDTVMEGSRVDPQRLAAMTAALARDLTRARATGNKAEEARIRASMKNLGVK